MTDTGPSEIQSKVHNFGVYSKSGKRAILQIDFPGKIICLIHRGQIKKSYKFKKFETYDSEENQTVVLKFSSGELEIDTDNVEEKYAICRLLGLINGLEDEEKSESIYNIFDDDEVEVREKSGSVSTLARESQQVIKQGILEKKGNTKIPTWTKRRVQIKLGEFAYYKVGEERALNIVQIWKEICSVKASGGSSIHVTVKDRTYYFRIFGDQRSIESEREDWIKAFEKALISKRKTIALYNHSTILPAVYDIFPSTLDTDSDNSSLRDEPVKQEEPVKRDKKSKHDNAGSTFYAEIPPDYPLDSKPKGPPPPIPTPRSMSTDNKSKLGIQVLPVSPVLPPQHEVPSPEPKISPKKERSYSVDTLNKVVMTDRLNPLPTASRPKPPGLTKAKADDEYSNVIKNRPGQTSPRKTDDEYSNAIKNRPGKKSPRTAPPDVPPPNVPHRSASLDTTYVDAQSTTQNQTPQIQPPAPPPVPPPPSIPPPPLPPMAPPLCNGRDPVKGPHSPSVKLKPVHWQKTLKVSHEKSLWKNRTDVISRINTRRLEEMFCVSEKDQTNTLSSSVQKQFRPGKDILIDQKRAQNLAILLAGLKQKGFYVEDMYNVLNSVAEIEMFPSETVSEIRRNQPTADDKEMYKEFKPQRDQLHNVDKFMIDLCDIPMLSFRLDLSLTLWDFPRRYDSVYQDIDLMWKACDELVMSRHLKVVMEYLLAIGNFLNSSRNNRSVVNGFQLSSIDKVLDVRGRESGFTMVHFLIEQLQQSDPELLQWPKTLPSAKSSKEISVKAINAEIEVLKQDLSKIKRSIKPLKSCCPSPTKTEESFQHGVKNFVVEYEKNIAMMDKKGNALIGKYRSVLEYFGEQCNFPSDEYFTIIMTFIQRFEDAKQELLNKSKKN